MQLNDFHFELPSELIAQTPLAKRSASRLLVQSGDKLSHCNVNDLPAILQPGDHLVFNDTRVIHARMFGEKSTGGKIELLIERVTSETGVLTKIRASKSPKAGAKLRLGEVEATVLGRVEDLFEVEFHFNEGQNISTFIEQYGQLPLPPYIERAVEDVDAERYQTVYAQNSGAVAAPTAGLHFDQALLASLAEAGISHSFVTLHVGAGTFMPVRETDISKHIMHSEWFSVSEQAVNEISAAKAKGGRIVAVGTTSVRALEAASVSGQLLPHEGETKLFLTPGSQFSTVDAMLTNFHLPESTLLMLVCAFGGYKQTLAAYQEAVNQRYRFFSYGDAMLVWPAP